MSFIKADRVQEHSITEGTGDISVVGVSGTTYRTFDSVMEVGDTCQILVLSPATGQWECSEATYSAANTLTRSFIVSGSNGVLPVDFGNGIKLVSMLPLASTTLVEDNQGNSEVSNDFRVHGDLYVDGTINGTFQNPLKKAIGYSNNETYVTENIVSTQAYSIRQIEATFSELGDDPISVQNGSSTITVTDVGHGATTGDQVTFSGLIGVANFTSNDLNDTFTLTVVDDDTYTITGPGNANATTTGGGAGGEATYDTYCIRLDTIPETTPTVLEVRVDAGMHGVTRRAHPLDDAQWNLNPRANPFEFVAVASTVIPNTICRGGHCYVPGTLIDASVELNALMDWARDNAPATIYLPHGGMYIQEETVRVPEGTSMYGAGKRNTFFFWADADDRGAGNNRVLATGPGGVNGQYRNVTNAIWQGFAVYGNRTKQLYRIGLHAIDLGGEGDPSAPLNIIFYDVSVFGSAGYGLSFGNLDSKQKIYFDLMEMWFSDGDGFDCKNSENTNDVMELSRITGGWHAMGDQGTNLKPTLAIPNNGITTTNGFSTATVSFPAVTAAGAGAGDVITIMGAATFNNIDPNGTWPVTVGGGGSCTVDFSPQVANASSSGGGAGMTYWAPNKSDGDAFIDMRGDRWTVRDITWEGMLYGRSGVRCRSGGQFHRGAEGCTMTNIKGIDSFTPSWVRDTSVGFASSFIVNDGLEAQINNIRAELVVGVGIGCSAASRNGLMQNITILGGNVGYQDRGEENMISMAKFIDFYSRGVQIYGFLEGITQSLPANPFTPVSVGSALVVVNAPNHGLEDGEAIRFSGQTSGGNGLTIVGSNVGGYFVNTVIDADSFNFFADGSNTDATLSPFGGASVTLILGTAVHTTTGARLQNVETRQTDTNTAIGWAIGFDGTNVLGRCDQAWINDCRDVDSAIPFVDYGDETFWGSGNRGGLPQNTIAQSVSAPAFESSAWPLIDFWEFDGDLPAKTSVDFPNLRHYRAIRVEVVGVESDDITGTESLNIVLSPDGSDFIDSSDGEITFYNRAGDAAGTSSIIIVRAPTVSTPVGAVVEINNFNQPMQSWIDVNGGMLNSPTSEQTAGAFISPPQAVFSITGGTSDPGVNVVSDIEVDGVSIMASPVDWTTSNDNTASLVASEINSTQGVYLASAVTSRVVIRRIFSPLGGSVGEPVEITVGGDVTVSTDETELIGNPFQAVRVTWGSNKTFSAGRINVYGRQ